MSLCPALPCTAVQYKGLEVSHGRKGQPLPAASAGATERASHSKFSGTKEGPAQRRAERSRASGNLACSQVHQDQAQCQLPREASSCGEAGFDLTHTTLMPGVLDFSVFVLQPYFPSRWKQLLRFLREPRSWGAALRKSSGLLGGSPDCPAEGSACLLRREVSAASPRPSLGDLSPAR